MAGRQKRVSSKAGIRRTGVVYTAVPYAIQNENAPEGALSCTGLLLSLRLLAGCLEALEEGRHGHRGHPIEAVEETCGRDSRSPLVAHIGFGPIRLIPAVRAQHVLGSNVTEPDPHRVHVFVPECLEVLVILVVENGHLHAGEPYPWIPRFERLAEIAPPHVHEDILGLRIAAYGLHHARSRQWPDLYARHASAGRALFAVSSQYRLSTGDRPLNQAMPALVSSSRSALSVVQRCSSSASNASRRARRARFTLTGQCRAPAAD